MDNSGSKFSLGLTIVVLLVVLVGGYYLMQTGSTPAEEGTQPAVTEEDTSAADVAQLEADAEAEAAADLDASLDGVDKEFGL